jgi:hypothetical protein
MAPDVIIEDKLQSGPGAQESKVGDNRVVG